MKEYWYCIIGPVERPAGGDLLMRIAVKDALGEIVPDLDWDEVVVASGWGVTEEDQRAMRDALSQSRY